MDLLMLLLVIAIAGFLVYLIVTYIPMPPIFQTVIYVVVAIVVILYLFRTLGANVPNVIQ